MKTRNKLRRAVRDPQGPFVVRVEKSKKQYSRKNYKVTY